MGLRSRDIDIPGSSKPDNCHCGKSAAHTVNGMVEIFDKLVPIRLRVCDDHLERLADKYSIKEET